MLTETINVKSSSESNVSKRKIKGSHQNLRGSHFTVDTLSVGISAVRVMLSMNSFMKSSEIKNRNRVRYDDEV